jgi:AcrR family transcriptional regulator
MTASGGDTLWMMPTDQQGLPSGTDIRARILDATEQIMLEEGYAGVSSRKVAARAGLKSKLLHYYFATMDALFIAAFQRREESHFARLAEASVSRRPLHDLWELGIEAAGSRLYLEFNALACHRPKVRDVIAQSNSRDRITVASALQPVFRQYGLDPEQFRPNVVATAMAGMARVLATDKALGTDEGHSDVLEFVNHLLARLEPPVPPDTKCDNSPKEELGNRDADNQPA